MGMQGPLTAQALGRSPFDEVVVAPEEEERGGQSSRGHVQQYDGRGRPTNPETKRLNRDIIRSHNEVMLVIGVAEQESQGLSPEAASQRRHEDYEDAIGVKLASWAHECVGALGLFGINGLRQRILTFRRYSNMPFFQLYETVRSETSLTRDILPGAPVSWLTSYLDRRLTHLRRMGADMVLKQQVVDRAWWYVRTHLELYVALQRLGLVDNTLLLPSLSYFIPFTDASPIPAPPPLASLNVQSVLQWVGHVAITATPFLLYGLQQKLKRDWQPSIWTELFRRLPNTGFAARRYLPSHRPTTWVTDNEGEIGDRGNVDDHTSRHDGQGGRDPGDEVSPLRHEVDPGLPTDGVEAVRRQSTFSARDDYPSDDEEAEGISAPLISFDLEATDNDTPHQGVWSAELRPSAPPETRQMGPGPLYSDSMLTQLPSLITSYIFTESVSNILIAPYEATALRLVARLYRERAGLSPADILGLGFFSNLTLNSLVNFVGVEFLHLVVSMEGWAAFTMLCQYFRRSDEEWIQDEEKQASRNAE